MKFSYSVRNAAFIRQGQRCAKCGKHLDLPFEDQPGQKGAWTAHALDENGSNKAFNCVILCVMDPNCHLNYAHGGNPDQRVVLSQFNFPYWVSKGGTQLAWYEIDFPVGQRR